MNWKNFFLLIIVAALWGPSFVFIKMAVETIPPLTLVLGRVGLGAIILYVVLRLQNGRLPRSRTIWKHIVIVALVHNTIPFVLFAWGEQYIDSALASILNGTTPLFTIILAHFFTVDDHLSPTKVTGVLLGFFGLILLVIPSFTDGVEATTWGVLAIALAAAMYGIAIVYTRNNLRGLPNLVAPTGQLIVATIMLLPITLIVDQPWTMPTPATQSIVALLALAILGTALAFVMYYKLLEVADASYVSMITYVIPVFGVVLGVFLLDETVTSLMIVGCGFILLGVMVVNGVFNGLLRRRRFANQMSSGD